MVSNNGEIIIDLTLTRDLKNIKVLTKDFTLIKTRHKAIEILIDQEPWFNPNPKFRAKNADWEKWKQFLQAPLEDYSTNFPLEISEKVIDQQANKLTDLIVGSAKSFFGLTEISNKRAKGWWNNNNESYQKRDDGVCAKLQIKIIFSKLTKNGRRQGKIPNCHFWGKTQNNINLIQNS